MLHHQTIHFPIALILVGAAVELLAVATRRAQLEWLAGVLLWLGVGGLIAAVGTGLWVEDSFGDARIPTHRNWGFAALGAGCVALLCELLRGRVAWLRWGRAGAFWLAAAFVIVTGDLGGEMGHGEDPPPPREAGRAAPRARDGQGGIVLPPPGRVAEPRRDAPIILPPPGPVPRRRATPRRPKERP